MHTAIQILTLIILVATTIKAILLAIITFDSIPIKEVFIALIKFIFYQDWL